MKFQEYIFSIVLKFLENRDTIYATWMEKMYE